MIRKAVSEDAEGIAQIYLNNWRNMYKNIVPEHILAKLDLMKVQAEFVEYMKKENQGFFVYEDNAEIEAIAGYRPDLQIDNSLLLDTLHVLPKYRLNGIGKKLIATVANYAAEKKYDKMSICVHKGNSKALAIYQHLGAKMLYSVLNYNHGVCTSSFLLVWEELNIKI